MPLNGFTLYFVGRACFRGKGSGPQIPCYGLQSAVCYITSPCSQLRGVLYSQMRKPRHKEVKKLVTRVTPLVSNRRDLNSVFRASMLRPHTNNPICFLPRSLHSGLSLHWELSSSTVCVADLSLPFIKV